MNREEINKKIIERLERLSLIPLAPVGRPDKLEEVQLDDQKEPQRG